MPTHSVNMETKTHRKTVGPNVPHNYRRTASHRHTGKDPIITYRVLWDNKCKLSYANNIQYLWWTPSLLAKSETSVLLAAVGFERVSLLQWYLSVEDVGATTILEIWLTRELQIAVVEITSVITMASTLSCCYPVMCFFLRLESFKYQYSVVNTVLVFSSESGKDKTNSGQEVLSVIAVCCRLAEFNSTSCSQWDR